MTGEPDGLPQRLTARSIAMGARPPRSTERHVDALDDGERGEVAECLDLRRAEVWRQTVPSRFQWATLADFEPPEYSEQIHDDLTRWAKDPGGANLVLFGPVGTGKTHAAVAACRVAHDHAQTVVFAPVVELLDELRPGGPEDALERFVHADRLILDELGAERGSEWTDERLYVIVNRRWLEERPTIVTTNLEHDAFEELIGPRMFSRLIGSGAVSLQLRGRDRRRRPT